MGELVVVPTRPVIAFRRVFPILVGLAFLSPLALDMYLPALPAMTMALSSIPQYLQLTLTIFLVGEGLGMLAAGPLADRLGRRPVLLTGAFVFSLTSFAAIFVQTIEALLMLRFLQALGCGASLVAARTMVRDLQPGREAAHTLSQMALIVSVGPLLSPLFGAVLLESGTWRAIFGVLAVAGVVCLCASWLRVPETQLDATRGPLLLRSAFAAYGRILFDLRGLGYILVSGLSSGALFAYLAAGPFVFIEMLRLAPLSFAALLAGNAALIMAVVFLNGRLIGRLGAKMLLDIGIVIFVVGAMILAVIGALNLGGVLGVALPLAAVLATQQMVHANSLARLLALFPGNAGAAVAAQGLAMFLIGALASGLVSLLYNGTPAPLCLVIGIMGVCVLASRMLLIGEPAD